MFWASMLWSKTVGAIKNGLQYERRNSFYTADWRFRELLPILECWIFKMNDEKHFIAIFAVRVETFLMNSLLDGEFVIFHLEDVCVRLLNVCVFILKICFKKLNVFSVKESCKYFETTRMKWYKHDIFCLVIRNEYDINLSLYSMVKVAFLVIFNVQISKITRWI